MDILRRTKVHTCRKVLSLIVTGWFIVGGVLPNPVARRSFAAPINYKSAVTPTRSKLKKHDRLRLIEARLQEKSEVTLVIAASPGANKKLIDQITNVGGRVQYQDDDVSYVRVKVPLASVEKIAQSPEVEALNVDGSFIYVSQAPVPANEGQNRQNRIPPPDAKTPAENPYLPSREIGAPQFISSNPTFDGRGVVVAIVDTNIDVLTPELQTAKTLDGKPTRKILDITNATMYALDPSDDKGRLSSYIQVDMREEVNASNAILVHRDMRYTAPADGQYRFGMLDERMNGNSKGDINLDGNPPESNGLFAVLWQRKTNTVWVDTNQNRNFADEKAMSDYSINGDIGLFGKENAPGKFRRTVGFTIQTDTTHQLVFITPGLSVHGTAVTGGAFGKHFFGGSINGVAPEAQIVSVPFLGVTHSLIESLIVAVKHPHVDIVSVQAYFYVPMNDGDSTLSNVCNRLVEKYKKPIFSGAGNSVDAVNVVQEGAAASRVIAVGSYINGDTSRVNYGVATTRRDNIDIASSRGPTEVGAFKPDILAPTMSLTTTPGHTLSETYNNTYELPPGYGVGSGTSTATPMAAAAAALLVSAAKQNGVPYDASRLRWAITTGARYLPEYGAYEQGTGLFQIGPAWQALQVAKKPVEIETQASVKTVLSQFLKEPDQGYGIYEREGWTIGQRGTRIITLTRKTGKTSPTAYLLRWLGNDGTFSCPSTITLPLGSPVDVKVVINAQTPGVHSALLSLDEIDGTKSVHRLMTTIVAAEQFSSARGFRITRNATAEWMDSRAYYFYVPPHTPALDVNLNILKGNARLLLLRPSGDSYYKLATYSIDTCTYQTGGTCSQTVVNPEPGVWQVLVDNKSVRGDARFSTQNQAVFTMNATLMGVQSSQESITINSATTGPAHKTNLEFTNHFGSVEGGVMASSLGTFFSARPSVKAGEGLWINDVNVAPGTQNLMSTINNSSHTGTDLDLYIFDCTTEKCVLRDFSQRDGADEHLEVLQPSPGKWRIVVDPVRLPPGHATFNYADFMTNQVFGQIVPIESSATRLAGSTWVQAVNVRVDAVPTGSRQLAGFVTLKLKALSGNGDHPPDKINNSSSLTEVVLKKTMVRIGDPGALVSH